jgi:hypothetical protein
MMVGQSVPWWGSITTSTPRFPLYLRSWNVPDSCSFPSPDNWEGAPIGHAYRSHYGDPHSEGDHPTSTCGPHSSLHLGVIQCPSCTLRLGSQHEHLAQDGLWLLGRGPVGPYPSSILTGRLHYNAGLRDRKGCVDWVSRFLDLGWFHGHGYGSSSADLHHPREALPGVS